MFLRRDGTDGAAPAVAFGSHLDTVPDRRPLRRRVRRARRPGGDPRAGRRRHRTRAPLELVNWTNEEGSRFRPAMMGSRVHAGDMALEDALAITDDNGVSVREALQDSGQAGPADAVARAAGPAGWRRISSRAR